MKQKSIQLPRHSDYVKDLIEKDKIGKTTIVFARFLDGVNSGIEKLNHGFFNLVDLQMQLGPRKLPKTHLNLSFQKMARVCINFISSEINYVQEDLKTSFTKILQ